MKHRLLIAGSRDFNDYQLLKNSIKPENVECIISGCARGADTLAIRYAEEFNIPVEKYPADWNRYGRSAGYIRNKVMVDRATAVICFWDGQSKGTQHTINITKEAKKPLKVVNYSEL